MGTPIHSQSPKDYWALVAPLCDQIPATLIDLVEDHDFSETKKALDLGSGRGETSLFLLRNRWKVTAIDYSPKVMGSLLRNILEKGREHMENLTQKVQDVVLLEPEEQYDLIIAYDLFCYLDPKKLKQVWETIYQSLTPGGYFIGTFFIKTSNPRKDLEREQCTGQWFIKDLAMVNDLLLTTGYRVHRCFPRLNFPITTDPDTIEFCAQKREDPVQEVSLAGPSGTSN